MDAAATPRGWLEEREHRVLIASRRKRGRSFFLFSLSRFPFFLSTLNSDNRLLAHGKKLSKVKIMSVNVAETW